jgi:hypothetical protein
MPASVKCTRAEPELGMEQSTLAKAKYSSALRRAAGLFIFLFDKLFSLKFNNIRHSLQQI